MMRKKVLIVAVAVTFTLLMSFPSQSFASPPKRGDEATVNSALLTQYSATWDPYVWNWNTGGGHRVAEDQYSWVHWSKNGDVNMHCQDNGPLDGIWLATNIDQGVPQGLTEVDFSTVKNMLVEASTSTITGETNVPLASWTGAKFDAWAYEKGTNREIMMEMYIWRTGGNTAWGGESWYQTSAGSNVYNYRVALDWMRNSAYTGLASGAYEIESSNATGHYYYINLVALFARGMVKLNATYSPPFVLANYKLEKVIFCMESANNGDLFASLWVAGDLYSLRTRYNTADINGDGVVNVLDLNWVAKLYNTNNKSSNWDFRCDLNNDGKIDLKDLALISSHFGTVY